MVFRFGRGRWDRVEPAAHEVIHSAEAHGIPLLQVGHAAGIAIGERIICLVPTRYWASAMEVEWFDLMEVRKAGAGVIVVPVLAHSYDYSALWVDYPIGFWCAEYSKLVSVNPAGKSFTFQTNYANLIAHFVLERDLNIVMSPENFQGARKAADAKHTPFMIDLLRVLHKIRETTGQPGRQIKALERKFNNAACSASTQDGWVQRINIKISTQKSDRLLHLFKAAPYDSNWGVLVRSAGRSIFPQLPVDLLAAAVTYQGFDPPRATLMKIGAYAKPGNIRRLVWGGFGKYMITSEIQNTTYVNVLKKMAAVNVWASSESVGAMQLDLIPTDLKIKLYDNFWVTPAFQELKWRIVMATNLESCELIDEVFKTMPGWTGTITELEELLRAVL